MKKRKRLKKKVIFMILMLGIILCIGIYFYKSKDNVSNKAQTIMKEKNISKDEYSKTLEYVLLNNIYDELYKDEYKDIEYSNQNNFEEIITTFLPKGYSGKEINYILYLSNKNIEILKNINYVDIKDYYKIKNFDASKIERYNKYKEEENISFTEAVTRVNIKLDLPVYTDTTEVNNPDSLLVLVNKYNHLPKNYKPSDLVNIDGAYGNEVPIRKVIKEAFLKLQKAAKNELNITIMPTTAFRGESFQTILYNNYVAKEGVTKADTYSARPSYSEHQTGLAIDLKNIALSDIRLTDDEYAWLYENSYKYGFIVRFPENKENITLYQFENWHIRYVGENIAKIIHDNKLTLEEYIDLYETEY